MKPAMNGILLELRKDFINFVSSDGHRLTLYKIAHNNGKESTLLIPRKGLITVKQLLINDDSPITIKFNKDSILMVADDYKIYSRLIDEKFPDYEKVIPRENNKIATIDREIFLSSLKRISLYAMQSTNQVRLDITNDMIKVSAEDKDTASSAQESLKCNYNEQDISIGFNARFSNRISKCFRYRRNRV